VRQHLVIRRESYVAGTRARPEVGIFTQTHTTRPPVPWNRIAAGDLVCMKCSGGPIVATARVQGFRQIPNCSVATLRATIVGFRLHDREAYCAALREPFFALTVYLDHEQWLDDPIVPAGRGSGESWIVIEDADHERAWLTSESAPCTGTPVPSRAAGHGTEP
jgi:hypothetical protein